MSAKETKDKILKCTTELITERGGDIDNVTIRMIASRAGVGVGLTNHYFESKEQLVNECNDRIFAELFDTLKGDMTGGDDATRKAAGAVMGFLIKNEAFSKAALIRDTQNPSSTDYTAKLTDAFAFAMVDRKKFEEIENNDRMTERMKEQFKEHRSCQ